MKKLTVSVVLAILFCLGCGDTNTFNIHCACCGSDTTPAAADAQTDTVRADAASEGSADGSADAVSDSAADGSAEAGSDATADGSRDASSDAADVVLGDAAVPLMFGDLIKASGPATYYYARDSHRYVFPNENTYYSWYPDFSGIRTIPDWQLAGILIGGNVTIRPGTYLVKIATDPKVYAITTGGVIHWIVGESVMIQLYGLDWRTWVLDVPDSFFPNYTIGAHITVPVHPQGTLINYARDPTAIYVMDDSGHRRLLTGSSFTDNGFHPRFVITTTIEYPDGPWVTGREPMLADTIYVP